MNKNLKTLIIVLGFVGAIALFCVFLSSREVKNFSDKYEGYDFSQSIDGLERTGTYKGYLAEHAGAAMPAKTVDIDVTKFELEEGNAKIVNNFEGEPSALYTETESEVTFGVNVPEAGFYNIYLEYLIPESRGVAAERSVKINGELPFDDALDVTFARVWKDAGPSKIDNQGNEIRPSQIEEFVWQSGYVKDKLGYQLEPYKFYFEKGANTITIGAVNEPMYIKSVSVKGIETTKTYADYVAEQPNMTNSASLNGFVETIEGESSTYRSESSLYAKYDRSSPTTQPNSVTTTVLNYVGGDAWKTTGQWIEWEFEVPEDGFYNIMIKARQNYQRGSVTNRMVYIDGEVPFQELSAIGYDYRNDWECKDLAAEDGTPYNFYLTKGKHTIRLEATLGDLGVILSELEESTYRLNQIYRKLLVFTGVNPDKYRDYKIKNNYPEILDAMETEYRRLYKIVDDMVAYTGQKADQIASAQTVAQQIERFCKKPQKITVEFTTFKDNITALGTSQLNMSETKLDVDYIKVSAAGTDYKHEKANMFTKGGHELKSFIASFFVDYNSVGDVYEGDSDEVVKVWVLTGRDQGTILKSMIDDDFIPNSGVKVNVEVIDAGALMNAVMAGRGPNVVLSVGADQPVNYALRHASVDLTQFDGWQDVFSHYSESSYEQYKLEGGIYAVPEQQTFNVLFYRKDVLEELELEVPNTWKELIEMLPTIQGKNLSVGIPSAAGSSNAGAASTALMANAPDLSMYFSLLYQYGGDMYNANGTKTTVDTEAGIQAFDDYVRYFNDYGLPTIYDAVSRFRSGEMPLIISAYSVYNTLMVSAPEIRGLWDFTLIPGTEYTNADGSTYIDRSDFITGNATMMIENESESLKKASWEFMKWWANPDTQVRFGREIEALLGSSARYATANRDAFSRLSWSVEDIKVLNEQWDQTVGIREVPGGYYTGRHISNAIRKVINDKDDTRETIIDYSVKIDDEITKKRTEFGMSLDE